MSALRRAVGTSTDLACRAVSRRHVVRAARFVLYRARLDVPNDLHTNGETYLQRWILDLIPAGKKVNVIDVGANVGCWSGAMLTAARQARRLADLDLHAFEPSAYTFALLSRTLDGQPVTLLRTALSDQRGSAELHVMRPGAGVNSLHQLTRPPVGTTTETVTTVTLDSYADHTRLGHVALIKIDTEGHDLAVLRGARKLLADQRVSIAQFEYNHRWIAARSFLRDAFELLAPFRYRLGKLTPYGVEFYPGWDPELETFVEGNYVACAPDMAERLPSIAWWK